MEKARKIPGPRSMLGMGLFAVLAALFAACDSPSDSGTNPSGPDTTSTDTTHAPGAPTNVRAVLDDNDGTILWNLAPSDGGRAIEVYYARAVEDTTRYCLSQDNTCVIGSLTRGSTYTFVVKAFNAKGFGPFSAPSAPVAVPSDSPP